MNANAERLLRLAMGLQGCAVNFSDAGTLADRRAALAQARDMVRGARGALQDIERELAAASRPA